MGVRFRKSIGLGGGIRLNVGKTGVGVSAGVKGLRVSHGADGKTRITASIPGTGISYQETIKESKLNTNIKKNESGNSNTIRQDKPFCIVYGEYYGNYINGVLDEVKGLTHVYCGIHFYDDQIRVLVNNTVRIRLPISIDKLCIEMKRVEKKSFFSSSNYPLLILSKNDEFGSTEVHLKVDDFDMIHELGRTIIERKDHFNNINNKNEKNSDDEVPDNALFGQYHSIIEVDDDHVAVVITLDKGSIHIGDTVFLGKIDDDEVNCFSAMVSAIVSQEIELEWTDSEDGMVAIVLDVGLAFVTEYVGEGLLSDSVEGFLI